MGVVRNFIDIIGITPEKDLPMENKWQMMVLSESNYIFLPEDKAGIDTIYQIIVDMEIKASRTLKLPIGRIQILDAVKKFKIIYSRGDAEGQVNIINLSIPFNTFIEQPNDEESGSINAYILDAYFELIDKRRIYYNLLFMLDVHRADAIGTTKKNANRHIDFQKIDIKDIAAKQIYTESALSAIKVNVDYDIEAEYL